jgi:hypothetical protein
MASSGVKPRGSARDARSGGCRRGAGGKLHLRYAGGIGGAGSLELDLSFLQHLSLFPVEHREPRFPPEAGFREIPLLSLAETALVTR